VIDAAHAFRDFPWRFISRQRFWRGNDYANCLNDFIADNAQMEDCCHIIKVFKSLARKFNTQEDRITQREKAGRTREDEKADVSHTESFKAWTLKLAAQLLAPGGSACAVSLADLNWAAHGREAPSAERPVNSRNTYGVRACHPHASCDDRNICD
jgi:hypothetical protein